VDVRWLVVAGAACSGTGAHKPAVIEDAPKVAVAPSVPAGPYKVDAKFDKGDVQIRVEWKDTPTEARASAGRTACGTAKAPAVAPTTTWGIPDVVVVVDANHGKDFAEAGAGSPRIVLEKCALTPRVVLASSLIVASAADAPAQLAVLKLGAARPLAIPAAATETQILRLPISGHEVSLAVDGIVEVRSAEDTAIAVAPATPYYAVTEANGQVVLRDVPVGSFDVAAWLPARGGQPAKLAHGKVTVVSGGLAEVSLAL
jgi:hypothetical protein